MVLTARITVELLLRLKAKYGDLNKALILEYVKVNGIQSETKIAQDLGVNRSVVHRALQDRSESSR